MGRLTRPLGTITAAIGLWIAVMVTVSVSAAPRQNIAPGAKVSEAAAAPADAAPPGQTALFNAWEDAVECSKCGGRMVRTGSCYTCRDCGTNTGCS